MKTSQLLWLASFAASFARGSPIGNEQVFMHDAPQYPGFDLDLNAMRLVQMEGQPPVLMSELEKVHASRLPV
jgi:bacterial leucyl aminopeptidase